MLLPPRRRSLRDLRIVGAYFAGTLVGALLSSLAAWLASGFVEPLGPTVALALLVLGVTLVVLIKRGPLRARWSLPENRRQIPAEVFGSSLTRGAALFGFEMGTGVRTYVPSAAPYVLLLAIVLTRPPLGAALLAGLGFAVGRTAPLLAQLRSTSPTAEPSSLLLKPRAFHESPSLLGVALAGALTMAWA